MALFVFWCWRAAPHWWVSYEDWPQFFPLVLIKRINHRNDWGANVWIWMKAACVWFADITHRILIFKHVCACKCPHIYVLHRYSFFHSILIVIQAEHLCEDATHRAQGRCLKPYSRTLNHPKVQKLCRICAQLSDTSALSFSFLSLPSVSVSKDMHLKYTLIAQAGWRRSIHHPAN